MYAARRSESATQVATRVARGIHANAKPARTAVAPHDQAGPAGVASVRPNGTTRFALVVVVCIGGTVTTEVLDIWLFAGGAGPRL